MRNRFQNQTLFSWHWWLVLIATVCMTALTMRLGFWQLGRAHYKEAQFAQEQAQAQRPAVGALDFLRMAADPADLHRRVDVQGQWLGAWTVYLENRTMQGRPGFWVLTPLLLRPGAAVLVQRGWVPRDLVHVDKLPPIETPQGTVRVQGRWIAAPSQIMELGARTDHDLMQKGFRTLRQNIDVVELSRETQLQIVAHVLQTDPASEGLQRDWPPVLSGSDKNRAYALQWFALAGLCVGLFVWFQVIQKIRHGKR